MFDEIGGSWFRLIIMAAVVVLASALFAWLQRHTRFHRLHERYQQLIIGAAFGLLAIMGTEYGVPIGGATINMSDAAPLAAGMLFGLPAGLISGFMGGIERWYAATWGAGMFTREACGAAVILAGVFGGMLHHAFFRRERPTWWYALGAALCIEVLQMLLILVTNLQDLATAFMYVERCTVPMISANCLSLTGCALVVRSIDGLSSQTTQHRLEYVLQRSLFFSVLVAMIVSGLFIWVLQSSLIVEKARSLLQVKLHDTPRAVVSQLNAGLVGYTDWLADTMTEQEGDGDYSNLPEVVQETVEEVYLIDPDTGEVVFSSEDDVVGGSMPADWNRNFSAADGTDGYVTPYGQSFVSDNMVKYAMIGTDNGRALVLGFRSDFVQHELSRYTHLEAESRHVGETGYIIVADEEGHIDSAKSDLQGTLDELGFHMDGPNIVLLNSELDEPVFYMYTTSDSTAGTNYVTVAVQSVQEASFVSNLAMYVTIFAEIIVFAVLFMKLSSLIRKEMVQKLTAVNTSLAILTDGNLDEVVNVRSTKEFAELSDGINATVSALKRYGAEMRNRHARELEFARIIQRAALPSVFPPFPARRDFEIYASMDAAKVVGGDFYDFYLLNDHTLAFVIADVSGKGIPAAMFMMRAKTQIKDLIESGLDVAEVFHRTNNALYENNAANMFVTAWMGVLDLTTGQLRYINAGHTPPILERYGRQFEYLETDVDFVLGGLNDIAYEAGEVWLQPGDTIFIYTDGVTEAENSAGQQFGEQRLLESVRSCGRESLETICNRVLADVELFAGAAEQFDDITMLAVRVNGLMSRTSIQMRPEPSSTASAIDFARQRLRELQVPQRLARRIENGIAAVWERMVKDAKSDVVMTVRREDDGLFLAFYDDGPEYNPLPLDVKGLHATYERSGGHNLLELHWHIDDDDPDSDAFDDDDHEDYREPETGKED